ncbi:MAG: tetratricopeptide repeat protein [Spirochaetota bacterium]|jgi:tetratricopeptide (TPR) repeat protein|nr:tetratricopeptide repeat protein [Spirochaetota bacterium]
MDNLYTIVLVAFVLIVFTTFLLLTTQVKKKSKRRLRPKSNQVLIRDAIRKLDSDPHNPESLKILADIYFKESKWEKALPLFQTQLNIAAAYPQIDQFEAGLKLGICSLKLGKPEDAVKPLLLARHERPENFEINYNLGEALIQTNDFEKAIPVLRKALTINTEANEVYASLATAFYKTKRFKEALPYLKKTLDINPESKEFLYYMADSLHETGNTDKALKIFMHLRADPLFGIYSCLTAGTIHFNQGHTDKAIRDFEIGLKHQSSDKDIQAEFRYKLSQAYLKQNDIGKSLMYLKETNAIKPNYKDVPSLIARYEELNQNQNYRTYLIGGNSDFVSLCRKLVLVYFKKSRAKITNINVFADFAELTTDIETDKWEDTVFFRFYRTTSSVGELFIREFHAKIRDEKAGRGICVTAGTFSDESKKFIEGRPIDLIEKDMLVKMLTSIESEPNYLQL